MTKFSSKLSKIKVTPWSYGLASQISLVLNRSLSYFDQIIQLERRPEDPGLILQMVNNSSKSEASTVEALPDLKSTEKRVAILLNGNANYSLDVQTHLREIKQKLNRYSRVYLIAYNSYLRGIYGFASKLGLMKAPLPTTFLTRTSLQMIAQISGFEIVKMRAVSFFPFELFGLGTLLSRIVGVIPVLREFGFSTVVTLRPIFVETKAPSLTIVIPARNEAGNVPQFLTRLPHFRGAAVEVIIVEGNSTDSTWDEVQKLEQSYRGPLKVKVFKQPGKGKNDAVRFGFSKASSDLLTILDADLTMPPEKLSDFYEAYCDGLADFINGSRLVYPMEGNAMRFLNLLGNVFFAKALSYVLTQTVTDSLCGTKLVTRKDYLRMTQWRNDFGDFDPFGDFELIFPAAILSLGIVDIPVSYRARTYGETNIHRFYHGWILLKMTLMGFFKIRLY